MMLTSSVGIACPACCKLCNNGVMSWSSLVFVCVVGCSACLCTYWFPSACLNGLCIVLTKGCCDVENGSIVVVANGEGGCGLAVYMFRGCGCCVGCC